MRNGTIDFMKFISAIFIMFLHALMFMAPQNFIPFTTLAVDFFFIVSGLLLYNSIMHNRHNFNIKKSGGVKKLILNKIKNVYIEYIISLVLGYILLNVVFFESLKSSIKNLILCIGELSCWNLFGFPTDGWSNVNWYIITMLICSMIIIALFKEFGYNFTLLLFPILIFISYGFLLRNHNSGIVVALETLPYGIVPLGIIRGFAGMLLGCEAAIISSKIIKVSSFSHAIELIMTLVEIIGYGLYIFIAVIHKPLNQWNVFVILFLTISIAISFSRRTYLAPLFNHNIFRWLGLFSLNIYLNHCYIAYAIKNNKLVITNVNVVITYVVVVIIMSLVNKVISNYIRYRLS